MTNHKAERQLAKRELKLGNRYVRQLKERRTRKGMN